MSKFPTVISELSYAIFMSPNEITDIVVCIMSHINYRLTRNIIIILLRSFTTIQISFFISFLDVSMIKYEIRDLMLNLSRFVVYVYKTIPVRDTFLNKIVRHLYGTNILCARIDSFLSSMGPTSYTSYTNLMGIPQEIDVLCLQATIYPRLLKELIK